MHKTLQGYKIINFPQGFSKIIEAWFAIIREYALRTGGDTIYWYNERANVGAFAAALARNKYSVLEEFGCEKGWGPDRGIGRADISFFRQGVWYLGEAKLLWKLLSPRSRPLNTEKLLETACQDAKRSWQGDRSREPFGLTFVVPYIHGDRKNKPLITDFIRRAIQQLEADNYADLWAYCAPGNLRHLRAGTGDYCPMVIVLAKKIRN